MMATTLETAQTVSAVVSVFHNGADLVKQISKKSKKKKGELAMKQKWLLESLESGEVQISQRYSQHFKELGTSFKVGDQTCSGRLQHIAIMMQAETLRSLQIALQYDNATLDLVKLQEDAAFHRRDVLAALDELKMRLTQQSASAAEAPRMFNQLVPTSPTTPDSQSSSPFPSGVSVPDEEEHNSRMSRLFSIRGGKSHKRSSTSSSAIAQMVVSPSLNWLGPEPEKKSHFELPANEDVQRSGGESPQAYAEPPQMYSEPSQFYGDIKAPVAEPNTSMLHPAMARHSTTSSVSRHASTSTHSSDHSNHTRDSAFSDEKIPVVTEDEESTFPNASDIAEALPPALIPTRIRHSRIPSSPTLNANSSFGYANPTYGSTIMSPTSTASTGSPLPSPININPDASAQYYLYPYSNTQTTIPQTHIPATTTTTLPLRDRSNTTTTTSSTSPSLFPPLTSQTTATPLTLLGRPSKANNYWGFCKGAWSIRESWSSGLQQQVIPAGMFAHRSVWRCRHCQFSGSLFGDRKPFTIDPNVHTDADTGVRYKWLFLAKCHIKLRVASKEGEAGYGCLLCSEGNVKTGVWGSKELLFRHVREEHVPSMTAEMAVRASCVLGRKADVREEWDINVV